MKILAVDDKPDNIDLISDIVEALGYEVIKAYDGPQALDMARIDSPDLILLDINMPGMSGFEVVTELKADDRTSQIPVIMVSALSDMDNRIEGLGLGADDYLVKPFNARELVARIEARLRTKFEADSLRNTQEIILRTFERFVSPTVVQQLLQDPSRVKLGGKLQEITVFFCDLENFTAVAEHADPEVLLGMLNRYHELIVRIAQENGGTIDKFIGDGVMVLYNTPVAFVDHPLQAVRTACEIRQSLPNFHQLFDPVLQMKLNFGIHTGMAIVGNVGAPQLMDFTAVGDTVNIASRLQGHSEGGQILISEDTFERVASYVNGRPLGLVQVKGRSVPVMTYEVLTMKAPR